MTALMRLDNSLMSIAASMPFRNNFRDIVVNKGQVNVIDGLKSFVRMREFELNELKDIDKNFLDEYAYILLCKGIIVTACDMQINKVNADIADYIEADYKTSKQLLRRMEALKNDLDLFCDRYFFLNKQVAKKCEKMLNVILSLKKGNLQLMYLAYYILKMRFMPFRSKVVVSDQAKWIIDKKGQLNGLIELIDATSENNKDEAMASLAKMIVKDL
jgi:hypothetical protein